MKCIGKQCRYNQCNAGEYCGLSNAFYTCKGDDCVIDERIQEVNEEISDLEQHLKTLNITKEEIERNQ